MSVTVDWMHREAARTRMRVLVKRLHRKYGYPPELQDAAKKPSSGINTSEAPACSESDAVHMTALRR